MACSPHSLYAYSSFLALAECLLLCVNGCVNENTGITIPSKFWILSWRRTSIRSASIQVEIVALLLTFLLIANFSYPVIYKSSPTLGLSSPVCKLHVGVPTRVMYTVPVHSDLVVEISVQESMKSNTTTDVCSILGLYRVRLYPHGGVEGQQGAPSPLQWRTSITDLYTTTRGLICFKILFWFFHILNHNILVHGATHAFLLYRVAHLYCPLFLLDSLIPA